MEVSRIEVLSHGHIKHLRSIKWTYQAIEGLSNVSIIYSN